MNTECPADTCRNGSPRNAVRYANHLADYTEISKHVEELSYRDKLRLAQLLIQLARKEEEEQHPDKRDAVSRSAPSGSDRVQYVAEKLKKLRPSKKQAVLNSIGAMFQFQGGISDKDKTTLLSQLLEKRYFTITQDNHVHHPTIK
jgi:hypothetical protein